MPVTRYQNYARLNNALPTGAAPAPFATVTVRYAGTPTLAPIYSDDLDPPTVQANPFIADARAYFDFYAEDGLYDVTLEGGGIVSPYTWPDIPIVSPQPLEVIVEGFSAALVPPAGTPGRLAYLTDTSRGLILDNGSNWSAQNTRTFNIEDFGAVADDATDNTAAITAAITAALVTGGIVLIPARALPYLITGTLALTLGANQRAVSLVGQGWGSILHYTGAGTAITVSVGGSSFPHAIEVGDFWLQGSAAALYGVRVLAGGTKDGINTRHVLFTGFTNVAAKPIYYTDNNYLCRITENFVLGACHTAIYLGPGSISCVVEKNWTRGWTTVGIHLAGSSVLPCNKNIIRENIDDEPSQAGAIAVLCQYCDGTLVSDNNMEDGSPLMVIGVRFESPLAVSTNNVVQFNRFSMNLASVPVSFEDHVRNSLLLFNNYASGQSTTFFDESETNTRIESNADVAALVSVLGLRLQFGVGGAQDAPLTRTLVDVVSLNFGVWSGNDYQDRTFALSGANLGSVVKLGLPDGLASLDGLVWSAWVSTPGNVTVRGAKMTAGATADPGALSVTVTVDQYT